MHRYKHILVGADLISSDDDPVVERAIEISQASGAEISLLHVVEPFYNYVSPYVAEAITEWQEQTLESARNKLNELAKHMEMPVKNRIVVVGQLRDELLRTARSVGADLIMVGSHGRHGVSLFLHGSVANEVINYATCDVLAVSVRQAVSQEPAKAGGTETASR